MIKSSSSAPSSSSGNISSTSNSTTNNNNNNNSGTAISTTNKKSFFMVLVSCTFCVLVACFNMFGDEVFFQNLTYSTSTSTSTSSTTRTTTRKFRTNSNENPLNANNANNNNNNNNMIYGHIHIAKTGGTTLNALFANTFERVCGNKGNSYKQYQVNERAKQTLLELQQEEQREQQERDEEEDEEYKATSTSTSTTTTNSIRFHGSMEVNELQEIGLEDCDYISTEINWKWWVTNFANSSFHGIPMELHIPCRSPIEHLMSQCNYWHAPLQCGENSTHMDRKAFIDSVKYCFTFLDDRYQHDLLWQFEGYGKNGKNAIHTNNDNNNDNDNIPNMIAPKTIKCYDFEKQFTTYMEYMSQRLQPRRIVSTPFVKLDTNSPRNKSTECIWNRPDLIQKTNEYLLKHVQYYQFCNACMGSDNEITL